MTTNKYMRKYYRKNAEKIKQQRKDRYKQMREANSNEYKRKLETSANYYNHNREIYRENKKFKMNLPCGTGSLGSHRDPDFTIEHQKITAELTRLGLRK